MDFSNSKMLMMLVEPIKFRIAALKRDSIYEKEQLREREREREREGG